LVLQHPSKSVFPRQGPPKGALKPTEEDMGDLTDAFMTAAVLMAGVVSLPLKIPRA